MILLVRDNGGYALVKELNKTILAIRDEIRALERRIAELEKKIK